MIPPLIAGAQRAGAGHGDRDGRRCRHDRRGLAVSGRPPTPYASASGIKVIPRQIHHASFDDVAVVRESAPAALSAHDSCESTRGLIISRPPSVLHAATSGIATLRCRLGRHTLVAIITADRTPVLLPNRGSPHDDIQLTSTHGDIGKTPIAGNVLSPGSSAATGPGRQDNVTIKIFDGSRPVHSTSAAGA